MPKKSTLFLVQTAYPRIEKALDELKQIVTLDDNIVLFDDAVFALNFFQCQHFKHISVLESDTHLIPQKYISLIEILNYQMLAKKINTAHSVITWK